MSCNLSDLSSFVGVLRIQSSTRCRVQRRLRHHLFGLNDLQLIVEVGVAFRQVVPQFAQLLRRRGELTNQHNRVTARQKQDDDNDESFEHDLCGVTRFNPGANLKRLFVHEVCSRPAPKRAIAAIRVLDL